MCFLPASERLCRIESHDNISLVIWVVLNLWVPRIGWIPFGCPSKYQPNLAQRLEKLPEEECDDLMVFGCLNSLFVPGTPAIGCLIFWESDPQNGFGVPFGFPLPQKRCPQKKDEPRTDRWKRSLRPSPSRAARAESSAAPRSGAKSRTPGRNGCEGGGVKRAYGEAMCHHIEIVLQWLTMSMYSS